MAARLDEAAVAAQARRMAGALARRGLRAGDAVAALLGNTAAFVAARDAATALDLAFVPVNPKLAPPEIELLLARSGARLLVVDETLAPPALLARPDLVPLAELDGPPGPARAPGAIGATILFTSGTTGQPKACLRSAAQEAARAAELTRTYQLSAADVHLVACPLAHSAPGIFLRAARAVGAATVLLGKFDARALLDAIARERATLVFLVPTQVERLLALPAADRAAADLASLRVLIVAGAPFATTAKRRLLDWLGPGRLWEFYGASETGTITVLPPSAQPGGPGAVGWPPPGVELRLLGADGREVPAGTVGEIFVRSPAVMQGYLGEAAAAAGPDDWVSVGDLGRLGTDGALTLVDRKHDLIISGGVNVYPAEVERALGEHPEVAAAVVTGVPDPDWGERVVALVAARPGAQLDPAELLEFLRARIAAYKLPKRLVVVAPEELPLGATGKPLRRAARSHPAFG